MLWHGYTTKFNHLFSVILTSLLFSTENKDSLIIKVAYTQEFFSAENSCRLDSFNTFLNIFIYWDVLA